MRMIGFFILICSSALIFSCSKTDTSSGNLYVPSASDVTANATLEELQQGRVLYINNCGVCHSLYSPDSYSATKWKIIMTGMSPKTDMNSLQVSLVTKYVSRGQ